MENVWILASQQPENEHNENVQRASGPQIQFLSCANHSFSRSRIRLPARDAGAVKVQVLLSLVDRPNSGVHCLQHQRVCRVLTAHISNANACQPNSTFCVFSFLRAGNKDIPNEK